MAFGSVFDWNNGKQHDACFIQMPDVVHRTSFNGLNWMHECHTNDGIMQPFQRSGNENEMKLVVREF